MRSIQGRLALWVGLGATLFWLAAAGLTADRMTREIRTLFDEDLRATAERLLPLAGRRGGDDDEDRVPRFHGEHDDDHEGRLRSALDWEVTDAAGNVVLRSEGALDATFPTGLGPGFSDTATHRIYQASGGGLTITVAAPLTSRAELVRALMLRLVLPLALLLPLSLVGIAWAVRRGLAPLRGLSVGVAARGAQDLSPLATDLPTELRPIGEALNDLLARLQAAFEAERSFAAQAAHELRTPVAGVLAQVQRLKAEIPAAAPRAIEIETALKRLMRTSEKLMQLARAEGGRVTGAASDIRPVVRMMVEDARRLGPVTLTLPEAPALSVIEPDALGIALRNLLENAQRHGDGAGVSVRVLAGPPFQGPVIEVSNGGARLEPATLARLGQRFEKGEDSEGMGLGLAILRTTAERAGATLAFTAPETGGLVVTLTLPGGQVIA